MAHVRERPPLRLQYEAQTPAGRFHRWGRDEPRPDNTPSGERFSSTAVGGHEAFDASFPRKAGRDYADLERFTQIRALGVGGEIAWEGRLERAPRTSGSQLVISPSAVGNQAFLDDNKSAREIYVDRDLGKWEGPSRERREALEIANAAGPEGTTVADKTTAAPGIELAIDFPQANPFKPSTESWYNAAVDLAKLYYTYNLSTSGGSYVLQIWIADNDVGTNATNAGNLAGALSGSGYYTKAGRSMLLQWFYNATPAGVDGQRELATVTNLAVYGTHGLTLRGTDPGGVFASDIVSHAVAKYAPSLNIADDSIEPSGFVIPHQAHHEPTTAVEIVKAATRFGLQDWGVWDNKTFFWYPRGSRGRSWRARIAPAQLQETGPQLDRLWESVIVQYQDVDGSARTVGPTGSGTDTESSDLKDTDPDNPANKLGVTRRQLLQMGTSTPAGATEVGRRFLEESKLLDTSGQATLVGYVEDDRGVLHPYWKVRGGDTITFVDAADPSPRRIVKASHDVSSRTCQVDLDAPPEGLAALLERLGVVLVPLGIGS